MKKGQKKPYCGNRTKQQVIKAYFTSSASIDERPPKAFNVDIMNKPHSPIEERNQREKKYKTSEQLYIFSILKKHNLLIKNKKKRTVTTDCRLWRGQYPGLVQDIVPHRPEQVWVCDITYFRTKDGFF